MRFVRDKWPTVLQQTMDTVFAIGNSQSLESLGVHASFVLNEDSGSLDRLADDHESATILEVATVTALGIAAELDTYGSQVGAFPWLFCLVDTMTEEEATAVVQAALTEWKLVLNLESTRPGFLSARAPHTLWQWYREVMVVPASVHKNDLMCPLSLSLSLSRCFVRRIC